MCRRSKESDHPTLRPPAVTHIHDTFSYIFPALLIACCNQPFNGHHHPLSCPQPLSPLSPSVPLVCIGVLEKIDAGLDAKTKKNKLGIEEAIEAYCTRKDIDNKEKKLCYFLKPIKRDVSQPFSTGMPKAKVCERLKKKSAEICTIKYRKC